MEDQLFLARFHDLPTFLITYSWVYTFRWVTRHIHGDLHNYMHPSLEHLPPSWATALAQASVDDLKLLVSGPPLDRPWPKDLIGFIQSCTLFTRLLAQTIGLPIDSLPSSDHSQIVFNPLTQCVEFSSQVVDESSPSKLRMTPKKSHEVQNMAAFLDLVSSNTVSLPIPSVRSSENLCEPLRSVDSGPIENEDYGVGQQNANLFLVDIGSGLGHLPNALAKNLCSSPRSQQPSRSFRGVIAIECDGNLHDKALSLLNEPASTGDIGLSEVVQRLQYKVESSNLDELRARLREQFETFPILRPLSSASYLISGLHCCGDLSEAIVRLFISDPCAQRLVLVGCCYHKMSLHHFPWSDTIQQLFAQCHPSTLDEFNTEATFRLACQWSPTSWLQWTACDFNVHRIRLLYRTMLTFVTSLGPQPPLENEPRHRYRFDPTKSVKLKSLLISNEPLSFNSVYPILLDELKKNLKVSTLPDELQTVTDTLGRLWTLTPGILALQQAIQPVLELLILADRLLYIRQSVPLRFSGFVRLFLPALSPRCMALVACK